MLAFAILPFVGFALAAVNDISSKHFATEATMMRAPKVDLTPWGYHNRLPAAYDITKGGPPTYNAAKSYALFHNIVSGGQNRTSENSLVKRFYCPNHAHLDFDLIGSNGCTTNYNACAVPDACNSGDGCGDWTQVNLYLNDPAGYITFWSSTVCNGDRGSFNAQCGYNSGSPDVCNLEFNANSFKVYDGCHSQYTSDGC